MRRKQDDVFNVFDGVGSIRSVHLLGNLITLCRLRAAFIAAFSVKGYYKVDCKNARKNKKTLPASSAEFQLTLFLT